MEESFVPQYNTQNLKITLRFKDIIAKYPSAYLRKHLSLIGVFRSREQNGSNTFFDIILP